MSNGGGAGFVGVPIMPTFAGMTKQFADRLEKPAQESGKRAAKSISGSLESSVKSLERQVGASSSKVEQFSQNVVKAQSKVEDKKGDIRVSTAELTAAEEKYNKAVEKGGSGVAELAKVEKAKDKVRRANNALEQAEIEVTAAEKKHETQLKDLEDTTGRLEKAQGDLNKKLADGESFFGKAKGKVSELSGAADGLGGIFDTVAGKAGLIGGALAGAASIGEFIELGKEGASSIGQMNRELGLTGVEAEQMGDEVNEVLRTGVVGSAEEAGNAIGSLRSYFRDLSTEELGDLADNFAGFSSTFDVGMEEAVQTAGQLVTNGLAGSAEEAADMMTTAMQRVPAQMRDELPEIINEYGTHFRNLGFEGDEAFSLLISASEKGKWALDKTGDSLKEFSIRGSDMSKTSVEAYEAIGLNAEEMSNAIATGGEEARDAMQQTAQGLLEIEDPAERANAAIALFGTPVEDLAIDQIPDFLDSLTGATDGMEGFEGASQEMSDSIGDSFQGRINAAKGFMQGLATDGFMFAWDSVSKVTTWGKDAWADFTGFLGESTAVQNVVDTFTDVKDLIGDVTGILFNGEFDGMPFGIEEDSAFVDFLFNARDAIVEVRDGVVEGWDTLKDGAADLLEFLEPFISWVEEMIGGSGAEIIDSLKQLGDSVWNIAGAFASGIIDHAQTLWDILQALWDVISPFLVPILKVLGGILGGLLVGAITLVVGAFRGAIEVVGFVIDVITWLSDNVLVPLIGVVQEVAGWFADGLVNAIQILGDYFGSVFSSIGNIWDGFVTLLDIGRQFVVDTIFGGLGAGIDGLKDNFARGVEAIGKIWDGIKEAAAAPVRFMVETVWNKGIIRAIDAVAGVIGMDGPDKIQLGFARGGILPGWSRMSDGDNRLVPMRDGEGVLVSEGLQDQRSRDLFMSANEQAKRGKSFGEFMTDYVAGYANGGIVGSLNSIMREFYPELQMTSHFRPGDSGYHGKNMAADFSNTGSGMPSTPEMQDAAKFMYGNYGDQLEQLIHHPARNIGSGRDAGDGFGYYGAGTMNEHTDHIHLAALKPLVDPSGVVQMMPFDGDEGGSWFNPLNWAKKAWDTVINAINPYPDEGKGWFADMPGAFLKSAAESVWEWASGKIGGGSFDGAGGVAGNAESWRNMAVAAMRRNGFDADSPAQVNAMLAQIMSESGGIPDRNQEIVDVNGTGASAGQGLLQIIPDTFAAHRDPTLPNDRTDPWANMNAALRYYRSRYGGDLTTMWGHGHGYADGGIVDTLKAAGARLFDVGGILKNGGIAMNASGEDEFILKNSGMRSLGDVARYLGDMVPGAKKHFTVMAELADNAQTFMEDAADYNSLNGIATRSAIRQIMDIGGGLPGGDTVAAVLDGEAALWEIRDRANGHIANLEEKEKALIEARKELADLESMDGGMSDDDREKIDSAKEKLEDAKADLAKADSDKKRASAADKVADAEKNLAKVRKDVNESMEEDAKKHAEEIVKANEAINDAEAAREAALREQAADADNITLISQDALKGLIPLAGQFASQLTAMGAPAGMVAGGLSQVTGALSSVASMAGGAGITLGMAISAIQIGVEVATAIIDAVKEVIEKIHAARMAALNAYADGLQIIADYAALNIELQGNVASLQQELVRGLNEQRAAEFAARVAMHDRHIAEVEGALAVAQARLALDEEIERGALAAQIKLMGLHEDWDSYLAYQGLVSQGVLDEWSDAAISALFAYEAARAESLKGELSARIDQIKAEAALAEATRQNMRNQQDLLVAQERLIRMAGEVAGVDLVEATATSQVAKIVAEMAELQKSMDANWLGKAGAFLGTSGAWSNEYRGQQAQMDSLRTALDTVLEDTGVTLSQRQIDKAIKQMAWVTNTDGDPMSVLRELMPELVAAETALKIQDVMKPIDDARDAMRDADREVEDYRAEIDLYEQITPLEETLKGLEYAIDSLNHSSSAWGEGNEKLRGDYLAAAKANADAAAALGVRWKFDDSVATGNVRNQIDSEIAIQMSGDELYTAQDVDRMLAELRRETGIPVKGVISPTQIHKARRGELV